MVAQSPNHGLDIIDHLPAADVPLTGLDAARAIRRPKTIAYKLDYAQIAGDVMAGLLLSQLAYRFKPITENRPGKWLRWHEGRWWFPRRREDWKAECGLSPKQFDHARAVLVPRGLVDTKVFLYHNAPTVHVSLNVEALKAQVAALECPADTQVNTRTPGNSPKGKIEIPLEGNSFLKSVSKIQNPEIPFPTPSLVENGNTATPAVGSGVLLHEERAKEPPPPLLDAADSPEVPVTPATTLDQAPIGPMPPPRPQAADHLHICAENETQGGHGKTALPAPTWTDIRVEDFQETDRYLLLYPQLVQHGWLGACQADRLTGLALGEHVLEQVQRRDVRHPGGLYRALLLKPPAERNRFISPANEDAAHQRLKAVDYALAPPQRGQPVHRDGAGATLDLSKDAFIVHELQRELGRHGFHGDVFALLRQDDPQHWTEEHCATLTRELAHRHHGPAPSRLLELDEYDVEGETGCTECGETEERCMCAPGEWGPTPRHAP